MSTYGKPARVVDLPKPIEAAMESLKATGSPGYTLSLIHI